MHSVVAEPPQLPETPRRVPAGDERVLLVGLPEAFSTALAAEARSLGYRCTRLEAPEPDAVITAAPTIAITNLDAADGLDFVSHLHSLLDSPRIVSVTTAPCVFRVADAVRRGAWTVIARPTSLRQIIAVLDQQTATAPAPTRMSLDRAIWRWPVRPSSVGCRRSKPAAFARARRGARPRPPLRVRVGSPSRNRRSLDVTVLHGVGQHDPFPHGMEVLSRSHSSAYTTSRDVKRKCS